MIDGNNRIKCDYCGKYVSSEDHVTDFTPDSAHSVERILDFHRSCRDFNRLEALAKTVKYYVPSDAVFEDIDKVVTEALNASNELHKSLKMSHETFTRKFDIQE